MPMHLSFKNMFYALASVFLIFAVLVLAKTLLIPLGFALLISFILLPLANLIERQGPGRISAAIMTMVIVVLILGGGIAFFSTQILHLSNELTNFKDVIVNSFTDITVYINHNVSFIEKLDKDELFNRITNWLSESSGYLVTQTFSGSASFFTGFIATAIYTFLLLIYRRALTHAITEFYRIEHRTRAKELLKELQKVGQKYLTGTLILIVIIGLLNSIGLWIIGIDNPFLFGFLGAMLSIVPYVGTIAGAVIPILYAFITQGSPGMALAVGLLFWFVQLVSDNFLSPKIVGGTLRVNALAALLSLIAGALTWGVPLCSWPPSTMQLSEGAPE